MRIILSILLTFGTFVAASESKNDWQYWMVKTAEQEVKTLEILQSSKYKSVQLPPMYIHYVPENLVDGVCRQSGAKPRLRQYGCVLVDKGICHIFIVEERGWNDYRRMVFKAHEVMHCEGKSYD